MGTGTRSELGPVRLEVLRNALTAAADEMALALARAAYSTNIKTRLDFSCAIFDADTRLVAQSFGQANHLGSLTHFVPRIVEGFAGTLEEGDALACNGGRHGGVHLNDVCVVMPMFHAGELIGYCASLAHHLDVGGTYPGSISGRSREIYQEGVTIPPVRILRDGRANQDVLKLLLSNFRSPRETGGDIRAQLAAINVGRRRFEELIERVGWEVLQQAELEILDYTERRAREELSRLPAGIYRAEAFMDDDGISEEPVRVVVAVEIGGGEIAFDLTGSDPQRACAINATYAMTLSSCAYVARALMSPDLHVNAGFYRVLHVTAPEASIVNAVGTVGIAGGWETAFRVLEVAFAALAEAVPERLAAGSKGCLCNVAFGGRSHDGRDAFVFYEAIGGGFGARATKDGIDAIQPYVQNTENAPVEETEASYPVRIDRYELIPDSEGAGRFRGGLGLRRDYRFETPATLSILSDRAKFAPEGLAGGGSARHAHYVLDPGGAAVAQPSKVTLPLDAGATFSVQMAGGGGFGSALEREPALVVADVRSGRISITRAHDVYGVVVDSRTGTLNEAATLARRAALDSDGER